jgi:hypothetical protein
MPTEMGKKVDEIFSIYCQFLEDTNYEPPQGKLRQLRAPIARSGESREVDENDDDGTENSPRLKITDSRWKLSEDPLERKDSLWIWGLFEEPLYPFLLLQLTTDRIPLPGEDGDAIRPLALFSQINHRREKERGAVLDRGEVKIRVTETVKADIFGAATADIYEEVTVGTVNFEPLK